MALSQLETYRSNTVDAHQTKYFLEIENEYHMAYLRANDNNMDTGANTETINDVTQKNQAEEVTSYSKSWTYDSLFLLNEPVSEEIQRLNDEDATGGKTHYNMLEIREWRPSKGNEGKFEALRYPVAVVPTGVTNEAGGLRRITATITKVGDTTFGTGSYDEETGIATFTADTVEE